MNDASPATGLRYEDPKVITPPSKSPHLNPPLNADTRNGCWSGATCPPHGEPIGSPVPGTTTGRVSSGSIQATKAPLAEPVKSTGRPSTCRPEGAQPTEPPGPGAAAGTAVGTAFPARAGTTTNAASATVATMTSATAGPDANRRRRRGVWPHLVTPVRLGPCSVRRVIRPVACGLPSTGREA